MYHKNLNVYDDNFHIIAPAESFSLTKKPKDPILIYSYDHQYTIGLTDTNIIIDKWGDDLSLTNQAKSLIKRYFPIYTALIIPLIVSLFVNNPKENAAISLALYSLFIILYAFLYTTFEEKWNSKFRAR